MKKRILLSLVMLTAAVQTWSGISVISAERTVGLDYRTVYSSTNLTGTVSTNIVDNESGTTFTGGEWAASWNLNHTSSLTWSPGNLAVSGLFSSDTSGSVYATGLSCADVQIAKLAFTVDQPCDYSFSAGSTWNARADFSPLLDSACFTSLIGKAGVTNVIGCCPPLDPDYGVPNLLTPVSATNHGVLPSGDYVFQAVIVQDFKLSVGPFFKPPYSAEGSALASLAFSLSVTTRPFRPDFISRRVDADGTIVLQFLTAAGTPYVLEYTDALLPTPKWITLVAAQGMGSPVSVSDAVAGANTRYYRVRAGE